MATIVATEILGSGRLAGQQQLSQDEIRHAIDRHTKRITAVALSFQGQILVAEAPCIVLSFASLSEASLAAIEIQHRISDLPPVYGVRLNVRIGLHMAETEESALNVAHQLMRLALPEQILCGREILLDQVHSIGVSVRDLHQTQLEDGTPFHVVEVLWYEDRVPQSLTATSVLSLADLNEPPDDDDDEMHEGLPTLVLPETASVPRLCVRHQGKAFLLDEKTPFLTLGRDLSNDLAISDSRVSRQHARIERKDGQYYLVDMSTNGTFARADGKPEVFLRKSRLLLEGRGVLSFASSASQRDADKQVEYEFL